MRCPLLLFLPSKLPLFLLQIGPDGDLRPAEFPSPDEILRGIFRRSERLLALPGKHSDIPLKALHIPRPVLQLFHDFPGKSAGGVIAGSIPVGIHDTPHRFVFPGLCHQIDDPAVNDAGAPLPEGISSTAVPEETRPQVIFDTEESVDPPAEGEEDYLPGVPAGMEPAPEDIPPDTAAEAAEGAEAQ